MKTIALTLAALICGLFCARSAAQAAQSSRPVVMISIDGLRPDFVLQADRYGLKIPNLRSFLENGSFASGVLGVLPTVTYPSHTTLVTGVSPARHGIEANTTFDPLNLNYGGWYWYSEDIKVPTLWDVAAGAGLTTANVHWPVTVGARITYNLPQIWRAGTNDDRKLLRSVSTPGLLARLESDLGAYADGISETIEADENRARFAARLLELKKPDLMLAYFTALDHTEHETGPYSPQSRAVLERIDAIVAQLVHAAQQAYGSRAVIVIVSDHGFEQTEHEVNLMAAFREAGLVQFESPQGQKIKSWDATFWPAGGSAAVVLRDPSNTQVIGKVKGLLEKLASNPGSGVDRILDGQEALRLGGFPGASFIISLKSGYKLSADLAAAPVADTPVTGMHGFLPTDPEMRSSFFAMGPGIPRGRDLGQIDMRDIAPTLARFLHITLEQADGKALF
jgi:predicted AlkP superfamily pyrophosphatase or phosphodiesterase